MRDANYSMNHMLFPNHHNNLWAKFGIWTMQCYTETKYCRIKLLQLIFSTQNTCNYIILL